MCEHLGWEVSSRPFLVGTADYYRDFHIQRTQFLHISKKSVLLPRLIITTEIV